MNTKKDFFSSRWTFLLAALGMAIGAGNIWRFPRLAGQYGGSFLIPWMIFLFLWSIPLIIVEFSIGKKFRLGVIGAFNKGLGKKYTWMGWFVALCTIGIMFYYTVVCGWSLKYFILGISGELLHLDHGRFWSDYTSSNLEPVFYYILSIFVGCSIIYFGIGKGIEKATKILIPALFLLLIIAVIRAVSLPNAGEGLHYFFRVNSQDLLNYKVWLEALSQSAWSTGAGWGLILTYATYVKEKEKIVANSVLTGIGNNIASIICGLAVIPTVFALSTSTDQAYAALQSGNQGLTFIYIPQLFNNMTGGEYFTPIFFFALFIAALSSLISMLELAVRLFIDYGYLRRKAVIVVCGIAIVAGFPSAFSLNFFNNQDWVWGVGLLLSGFFFIFFALKYGLQNFREKLIGVQVSNLLYSKGFLRILVFIMILEFFIMFLWWFFQSVSWYPKTWWNPFGEYTIATCMVQWGFVILIGWMFNNKLARFDNPLLDN
jgi:NSS family neurotransmitter:Na+ symporter